MSQPVILDATNSIQYGNLTDSYDPNNAIHTKSRLDLALVNLGEVAETGEEQEDTNTALELFRIIKESSKLNVRNLKMIHKSSIITLIERNRSNYIHCPFDEFVYVRLRSVGIY